MTLHAIESSSQKASSQDELFMQQSLLFSDTLKEMKNLRKQLYSAAEFFEVSYRKQNEKGIVMESIKDYTMKAMINTVDHLGSVAFKVNSLLDEKLGEFSQVELGFTSLEQRVKTCQGYVNQGRISEQSFVSKPLNYHKRYIFPVHAEEEIEDGFRQTTFNNHRRRLSAGGEDSYLIRTGYRASTTGSPASYVRELHSNIQSPLRPSGRGKFSFTRILHHQKTEKRAASPNRFPNLRPSSYLKRSPSPNRSDSKSRYPSEPRRSVSLSTCPERNNRDLEQYTSKSKRLFKALTSIHKSRKDSILYKLLDEN